MPDPSSRALRRHHSARMKAKAHRVYPDWPEAFKAADHLATCSAWCCGNPRKHYGGPTLQERRLDVLAKILKDAPGRV